MTVASFLKKHDYHTACIGKWHLGWNWPREDGKVVFDRVIADGPTTRGFDTYFGTDVPNYPPYCFLANDRTVGQPTAEKTTRNLDGRPGPMLPGWKFDAILPTLVEKATGYIADRARDRKPFFLYFPLTSPHEPIAPSARFRGKSGISTLADFFMETDWAVGEVLAALAKHELAGKTLVVFTCDNGHARYTGLEALEKAGHRVSGPFRGMKADIWEGGHRVPFVVRWPGQVKAGAVCDETICHTNLLATCAAIVGAKLPDDAGEDSFSILPLLRGEKRAKPAHEAVVHQSAQGMLAIRQGKWKLILGRARAVQLYDLSTDVTEMKNVATEHPVVVKQLRSLMEQYIANGRSTPGRAVKNDGPTPLFVPAAWK
jgi:arylsulfatase A-like enzyme